MPILVSIRTKEVQYAVKQTLEPPLATVTNNLPDRRDREFIQHILDPQFRRHKQGQALEQ